MKKVVFALVIFSIFFSFTGCNNTETPQNPTNTEPKQSENVVIYDEDDVKISYVGLSDGALGKEIKLHIENNTDADMLFQIRDFSANGMMMTPIMSNSISAGKEAYAVITILQSELEKLNGEELKNCEFKIYSVKDNDLMNGTTTEPLQIDFS